MDVINSLFMKGFSLIMLLLFIASIILLVLTFRKPKKISVASLSISIAISLLSLIIFSTLINYQPTFWVWLLMIAIGVVVGIFWSRSTRVYVQDQKVMSKNSIWYLVVWGGIFTLNQLITIVTNRPPDIAMAMLIISTATVWGTSAAIITRYLKIKQGLQLQGVAQTEGSGYVSPANTQTTVLSVPPQQSAPVTITPISQGKIIQTTRDFCPKCGFKLNPDDEFCNNCGSKL